MIYEEQMHIRPLLLIIVVNNITMGQYYNVKCFFDKTYAGC